MEQENMNQKEFSQATGIAPATLSSIFNGRTSPTLNHAEALHRRFPNLSMGWLLFGEGEMFSISHQESISNKEVVSDSNSLFGMHKPNEEELTYNRDCALHAQLKNEAITPITELENQIIREKVKYIDKPQRKIVEIRIFFDDGTFEVFAGKN